MGSLAVVGGAGTGIYFLVDRKDGDKEKDKVGPGSQELTTPTTTPLTTSPASH